MYLWLQYMLHVSLDNSVKHFPLFIRRLKKKRGRGLFHPPHFENKFWSQVLGIERINRNINFPVI